MRTLLPLALLALACRTPKENPLDLDGDGYDATTDCDDDDPAVHPGADELCNDLDDDCDAEVDEDPVDGATGWVDADGDGWGSAVEVSGCALPLDAAEVPGDCDDDDASVHPEADELCNDLDDDCDGAIDEDPTDAPTWNLDADGDGFGGDATLTACDAPAGYVSDATDCDDLDAAALPGGTEVCDGVDNDCDGTVDEDLADAWFTDADGDGHGDPATEVSTCVPPAGAVQVGDDCDDTSLQVYPGAVELCDATDRDCDGSPDAGAADTTTWYADTDGDTHGDAASSVQACSAPTGYVATDDDCDDSSDVVHPGAPEVCGGGDEDCDGTVDEDDASDAPTWHLDHDGDGYGGTVTRTACTAPAGYLADGTDCDDLSAARWPGNTEICDLLDNDCDSSVDEGVLLTWYADLDGDGFGDVDSPSSACTAPARHVADSTDCDDGNASVSPLAVELCDGVDNDCSGTADDGAVNAVLLYADGDDDGWGAGAATLTCPGPGLVDANGDCDDSDPDVSPGRPEMCDGGDNDCDGITDEDDAVDTETWYADFDGDGYGTAAWPRQACTAPAGYARHGDDCDDLHPTVHPEADEVCDGLDNDCSGAPDADEVDGDGDGVLACDDCDDTTALRSPLLDEWCDGVDNDCSGTPDDDPTLSGSAPACAVDSCRDLVGTFTGVDTYWLTDGVDAYEAWCDLDHAGGGWTHIATLSDGGDDVWSQLNPASDAGLWDSAYTYGTLSLTDDYKSPAYLDVAGDELLITDSGGANVVLWTQADCWPTSPFGDFIRGLAWEAAGSDSNWSDATGAWLCDFSHEYYVDPVLRAGSHTMGSDAVLAFKWGEADGVQDGNKDRVMITTHLANGYSTPHHVDMPTGLGGFTLFSGGEQHEDVNECQLDRPYLCTLADSNAQLWVR